MVRIDHERIDFMNLSDQNQNLRIDKMAVTNIQFLSEQDGAVEKQLKLQIVPILHGSNIVTRAYLARVLYGSSQSIHVALCLKVYRDVDDALLCALSQVFTRMFKPSEHFDMLVIDDDQEASVSKVCHAFFNRMI